MNEWLKCMVGYYLLVSVTMHILPGKKYEHYVRIFTGLLLIMFLLRPVLSIGSVETVLEENLARVVKEQEKLEREILEESAELFSSTQISEESGGNNCNEKPFWKPVEITPVPDVEVQLGN